MNISIFILYTEVIHIKSLELTLAITALANSIACGLSVTELAFTASIFVQIGDTIATIAAERALIEECKDDSEE